MSGYNNSNDRINTYRIPIHETLSEKEFMKDCPNYNELPTILPAKKRIIVIGDVHGDLKLTIDSFKLAKLINNKHEWIANPADTVVVQVGDQIDSCRFFQGAQDCHNKRTSDDIANDIDVMEFFDKIHERASEKGGAVYSLLGNHELLNSQGRFNYVSYDNYHNFSYDGHEGAEGRAKAFAPGGIIAQKMACTRLSVIVIGSNMFIHAGILPRFARSLDNLGMDERHKLKYLNVIVRKWLLNQVISQQDKKIMLEDINLSPFWTRIYGSIPSNTPIDSPECETSISPVMNIFKIGKIVVGHTPQIEHNGDLNGTCNLPSGESTVYRVDGGFSRGFRLFNPVERVQVLEILDDNKFRVINNISD